MLNKGNTTILISVIVAAVLVIAVLGYLLWNGAQTASDNINGTATEQTLSDTQVTDTIDRVKELIDLQSTQEPLVASIVNVEQLRAEQAFYAGASNGDILLIFGDIQKAVIYSPDRDILVNVGPVIVDQ